MSEDELDALVAEKVFDFVRVVHAGGPGWAMADGTLLGTRVPGFSHDFGGAGMVIEEMSDRGWVLVLTLGPSHDKQAIVSFRKAGPEWSDGPPQVASMDPLPRAVNIAALRALGVEVPE